MTAKTDKKCKHPNCTCRAIEGSDYCGPQCEAMEDVPDIDCKCGHPGCSGHTT